MNAYIHKKVKAEEVFDMKKWAIFIAVNASISGKHALRWYNLRFYLNPETQLLEPVGFGFLIWFLKKGTWHLHKDSVESFYQPFMRVRILQSSGFTVLKECQKHHI